MKKQNCGFQEVRIMFRHTGSAASFPEFDLQGALPVVEEEIAPGEASEAVEVIDLVSRLPLRNRVQKFLLDLKNNCDGGHCNRLSEDLAMRIMELLPEVSIRERRNITELKNHLETLLGQIPADETMLAILDSGRGIVRLLEQVENF